MSLHDEPEGVIEGLRRRLYSAEVARVKISDLIAEIESGVFNIESLGFEDPQELWQLMPPKEEL